MVHSLTKLKAVCYILPSCRRASCEVLRTAGAQQTKVPLTLLAVTVDRDRAAISTLRSALDIVARIAFSTYYPGYFIQHTSSSTYHPAILSSTYHAAHITRQPAHNIQHRSFSTGYSQHIKQHLIPNKHVIMRRTALRVI